MSPGDPRAVRPARANRRAAGLGRERANDMHELLVTREGRPLLEE